MAEGGLFQCVSDLSSTMSHYIIDSMFNNFIDFVMLALKFYKEDPSTQS